MAKLSATRKLGIAARVAYQQVGRTRAFRSIIGAGRATAGHFGRVLGQLWLEVTGFVFLALAGIGAIAFFREYMKFRAGTAVGSRMGIAVCFTVLFGWFGLSSFWRVRKKD